VTLDGTENIHNGRRFDIEGKGTFSLIVDNVILALNLGMFVTVGFNYDRQNYTDQKIRNGSGGISKSLNVGF
jgi:sulfatase maturation enzyme AslB (radical SAM superfamily)